MMLVPEAQLEIKSKLTRESNLTTKTQRHKDTYCRNNKRLCLRVFVTW